MIQFNKNLFGIGLLMLSVLFHSCAKEDLVNKEYDSGSTFAALSVFNAIEGTENLQVLVDDKIVNKTDENFDTGGYLNYRTVFPGKRKLELISPRGHIYYKNEHDFKASKFYSYFFYGKENAEKLITEDELIKPDAGKLKFRVINLVSDSKIKMEFTYLNAKHSSNFDNRTYGFNDYSYKESFNFKITSVDGKHQALEIPFEGKDRSAYTIVIYTDLNEVKTGNELKFKILEI